MLNVEAIETAEIVGGSKPGLMATVGWKRAVAVAVGGKSRTPTSAGCVASSWPGLKTNPVSGVGELGGGLATAGRRTVSGSCTVGAGVQVTACVGRGGGVASSFATSVSSSVGKAVSVGSRSRGAMRSDSVVAAGTVAWARWGKPGGWVASGAGAGESGVGRMGVGVGIGVSVAARAGRGPVVAVAVSVEVGWAVAVSALVSLGCGVSVAVDVEVAIGSAV